SATFLLKSSPDALTRSASFALAAADFEAARSWDDGDLVSSAIVLGASFDESMIINPPPTMATNPSAPTASVKSFDRERRRRRSARGVCSLVDSRRRRVGLSAACWFRLATQSAAARARRQAAFRRCALLAG